MNKLCKNKLSEHVNNDLGVYKIDCLMCNEFYIGETGRPFKKRLSEHKNDVKNFLTCLSSAPACHVKKTGHNLDFNNAKIFYHCNDLSKRHVVESTCIRKFRDKCFNLKNGNVEIDETTSETIYKTIFTKDPF